MPTIRDKVAGAERSRSAPRVKPPPPPTWHAERHDELREAGVRLAHAICRRALRVRLARAHLVRVKVRLGLG